MEESWVPNLFLAIYWGVGFLLHKPYPYSLYDGEYAPPF